MSIRSRLARFSTSTRRASVQPFIIWTLTLNPSFVVVDRWSLVEASPRTGRLHQIRRHLKHLGHPLVGDVNYGKGDINRLFRERFGLRRLALHAAALSFAHPFGEERITITAPLPADLAEPLLAMGFPAEVLSPRSRYLEVEAE